MRLRLWEGALALAVVPTALAAQAPAPRPPIPRFAQERLEGAELARLHAWVAPGAERWAEIPWETDLTAARARSAKEGKPIFLWIMDGHPLGCT
jgi:hypothetical protein